MQIFCKFILRFSYARDILTNVSIFVALRKVSQNYSKNSDLIMFRCHTLFLLIVLTHAFYDASSSPVINPTENGNPNVNNLCQSRLKQVALLLCQKQYTIPAPVNTFGNNMARDCCTSYCSLGDLRKIYCPNSLSTSTTSSPTSSYESLEDVYGDPHSYETLHVQSEEFDASNESPEKSPNMEVHMDSISDEYNQPSFSP